MRSVLSGTFTDTTAATAAYLAAHNEFLFANLCLIGDYEDPNSQWLTDWESPLIWPPWGNPFSSPQFQFSRAVIKRGTVTSKIGLQVDPLTIEWTPGNATVTQSLSTASPYQRAPLGYYDNMKFRSWTAFMPTSGDCMTYGCAELFGGRIADTTVERGKITFSVNSFLDVVNEKVPTNVIEMTNTLAGYKGATPPAGMSVIPQFATISGSTTTSIIGDATTPTAHQIFATNALRGGFLVFNTVVNGTLARYYSAIASNTQFTVGMTHYNQFILYSPLPWAPTPGVDTFFVSRPYPINYIAAGWQALTAYAQNDEIRVSGVIQVATTPGTSGSSLPSFSGSLGGTTSDGSVVWTNAGAQNVTNLPFVPSPQSAG